MRVVVAIAREEPWTVRSRLLAYAAYAERAGIETVVMPLTSANIDTYLSAGAYTPAPVNAFTGISALKPGRDDLVIFSSPMVHHIVNARYGRITPRFLHLIQSATAASTEGNTGYGYRLLAKPMARIAVSERIARRIELVAGPVEMEVIPPSFALDAFVSPPQRHDAFIVTVHAADSDTAARTLSEINPDGMDISVRIIDATTTPAQRAAAYASSIVALVDPRHDEGLSQPAFEATAAGCALIMPVGEALTTLPPGVSPVRTVPMDNVALLEDAISSLKGQDPLLLKTRSVGQAALLAHTRQADEAAMVRAALAQLKVSA